MDYAIVNATEEDREELLSLYKAQIGRECCPWDEEYPGEESIDWDLSRNALYVMKAEGKILAAISFEEDGLQCCRNGRTGDLQRPCCGSAWKN